jgi:hypothetical protein
MTAQHTMLLCFKKGNLLAVSTFQHKNLAPKECGQISYITLINTSEGSDVQTSEEWPWSKLQVYPF